MSINQSTAIATAEEARIAREASKTFAALIPNQKPLQLTVTSDDDIERELTLPPTAVRLLFDILEQMALGKAVTIIPVNAELTIEQAADLLNVSRPLLLDLLDKNEIPHRKVGRHRQILFEELMNYKKKVEQSQKAALEELTAQAEELDLGY
ncbi:MAG: excisionase family DNA-binding protein [Roseofilum sp. SBFL]|uniref:excisionase family DNA-binding protein n=1 Tax=unclassified Roseofilum TaxID=2620099 RepID=UPI001B1979D4|nr:MULTISPECIES: excisionase family DNA-binding protein [unclassified Roseofilum]MBP0014265.1 excisionase family DNA-binding protein [Roseofilum sp. SID3]MBP0022532.1 excisionase family DNA-binding protein [Roseofilum sp. SID2]MBP0042851.1 excisionase family DNA-binding protein [Roseofilum sp. SBFL]